MAHLRDVAEDVRRRTGFRDVKVRLLWDDAPAAVRAGAVRSMREVIALQHALTRREVVVVPIMISEGRITREKIPADLEGLPISYDGKALLPHPEIARWIESRVRGRLRGPDRGCAMSRMRIGTQESQER